MSYSFVFLYQLSVLCGTPSSLSNGQRGRYSTTVGSRVTYTCNTGYVRTAGSSSRTCQSNHQWSGSHPTCTRKSTPAAIMHVVACFSKVDSKTFYATVQSRAKIFGEMRPCLAEFHILTYSGLILNFNYNSLFGKGKCLFVGILGHTV